MKIGELFVDLDFREGGAINKLTNFSIKFLALKTMASQVADTFDTMFGSVIDGVVAFENLNDTTGLSIERMQKWKALAEQNNVSFEDLISSLKNLQSASADIMLGKGNAAPFTQLGIDITRPREAFGLLNEIRSRIMEINDIGLRRNLLQEMGVSENMLILFKNFNGYYDENLQLTKEERDAVMNLNREWITLKQTVGMGWDKIFAQSADFAADLVRSLRDIVSSMSEIISKSDDLGTALVTAFDRVRKKLQEISDDSVLLNVLNGLVNFVYGFGELLGTGAAYAVEGYSNFSEWADRRAMESGNYISQVPLYNIGNNPNAMDNPYYRRLMEGSSQGDKTINVNNYINSSRPVDAQMMESVGNTTAQQIGNVSFMNGR